MNLKGGCMNLLNWLQNLDSMGVITIEDDATLRKHVEQLTASVKKPSPKPAPKPVEKVVDKPKKKKK